MAEAQTIESQPGFRDPRDVITEFGEKEAERNDGLKYFLNEVWPFVSNVELINQKLMEIGRDDLVITEKAEMKPVHDIDDMRRPNNFSNYLQVWTGFDEQTRANHWGTVESVNVPIPITPDELDLAISRGLTFDYGSINMDILNKPYFHRMMVLFPEFTKGLVLELSQPENRHKLDSHLPELWLAYQIASQLIDTSDPHVVRPIRDLKDFGDEDFDESDTERPDVASLGGATQINANYLWA